MPKTTHAELIFHALRYAAESLAEGDLHAILELGFRLDQIARLERLTLGDLHHLSQVRTHFLHIAVDPVCFDRVLDHMDRNKRHEGLQDELIRLRGPLAMMRAFFGMTNAEYAARRKLLGLNGTGVGRPLAPTEEEEATVWQVWKDTVELPLEQRFLRIGQSSGIPLNTVWALVQSWENAGLINNDPPEHTPSVSPCHAG